MTKYTPEEAPDGFLCCSTCAYEGVVLGVLPYCTRRNVYLKWDINTHGCGRYYACRSGVPDAGTEWIGDAEVRL